MEARNTFDAVLKYYKVMVIASGRNGYESCRRPFGEYLFRGRDGAPRTSALVNP